MLEWMELPEEVMEAALLSLEPYVLFSVALVNYFSKSSFSLKVLISLSLTSFNCSLSSLFLSFKSSTTLLFLISSRLIFSCNSCFSFLSPYNF